MKTKTLVIVALIIVFIVGVGIALLREVDREEAMLRGSISGVVQVAPQLYAQGVADVVRTDRIVLLLVDPQTRQPMAMKVESPAVPPMNYRIGQGNVGDGTPLTGPYLLVAISDKDGEIFRVSPGEVYGRTSGPIALGSEQVDLVMDQPFRGSLFNEPGQAPAMAAAHGAAGAGAAGAGAVEQEASDPKFSISGTVVVSPGLQDRVAQTDRMVILLFDPAVPRPVAFKVLPQTVLPQSFTIGLPAEAQADAKPAYNLRVVTDKDNNPFGSAEGELVGRSSEPIALGTTGLVFELNQPYVR